jgi:hypothetical protein
METKSIVFQVDSKEVEQIYDNSKNYLIEYSSEKSNNENYCIIYFSSNDIYYPNNERAFINQIAIKNKFEWYNTRISKGVKHIFVRDIKKQWYLTGINKEINNIDKLFQFLKIETEGYKVITLGSSAGGYAAVLLGSMLKADRIFTFNGQFRLDDLLESTSEAINPILFRERNNSEINKYFSLRAFIQNPKNIYYFYSKDSLWDTDQFNHISTFEIQFIPFKSNRHGIPFLKSSLKAVINLSDEELSNFVDKMNIPIIFSIEIEGFLNSMRSLTLIVIGVIRKKLFN